MQGPSEEDLGHCWQAEGLLVFVILSMAIPRGHDSFGFDTPYKCDSHGGLRGDDARVAHSAITSRRSATCRTCEVSAQGFARHETALVQPHRWG